MKRFFYSSVLLLSFFLFFYCCNLNDDTPTDKVHAIVYGGGMTDAEGNSYKTVIINGVEWMAEDMRSRINKNGEAIPFVDDDDIWTSMDDYSYNACCEGGEGSFLYKYSAAASVCPTKWHLASDADWIELLRYVGNLYPQKEGKVLKSENNWIDGGNGDDLFGLNIQPTGLVGDEHVLYGAHSTAYFWTSEGDNDNASGLYFYSGYSNSPGPYYGTKNEGMAVRCVK